MKMSKERLFLIPVAYTGDKKIVMEYKLVRGKLDYRTRFCKVYGQYVVDLDVLLKAGKECKPLFKPLVKGLEERVILSDAKTAYKFAKMIGR